MIPPDPDLEVFAGIAVSDFARAVAWYELLLGEPATFVAHETEHVWTLADQRSIAVDLRPERAGKATVTVFLRDLDAFVSAAAERGLHPDSQETYGNGVRKWTYVDPDGNEIGFGGVPVATGPQA